MEEMQKPAGSLLVVSPYVNIICRLDITAFKHVGKKQLDLEHSTKASEMPAFTTRGVKQNKLEIPSQAGAALKEII